MIGLLLLAAAPAQEAFAGHWRSGDAASWTLHTDDREAGVSWGRYEGPTPEGRHRFVTKTLIELGEMRMQTQADIELDARGLPVRCDLRARPPTGQVLTVAFMFTDESVRIVQDGHEQVLPLPSGRAHVVANNDVALFDVVLHYLDRQQESVVTSVFNLSLAQLLPYEAHIAPEGSGWRIDDSLGQTIVFEEAAGIVSVSGAGGWFVFRRDQEAREPEFDLAAQLPLRYERPAGAAWTDTDVAIRHEDISIAGTLSVPPGDGPHPAVFFISGSGVQDRHGFAHGLDLGTHEILDALAASSFLVLRVDDVAAAGRGYRQLVEDARACVRWLRGRPDVGRVFLLGHSEGALTAAILAAQEQVTAIASLAGPGRNLTEIMVWQAERLGQPTEPLRGLLERVAQREDPPPDALPQEAALWHWLRDHQELDVAAVWRAVPCPVWVAQGRADVQISPELDARVIAQLVGDRATLRLFEELDHLFKPCPGGRGSLELYSDRRRRVDPAFCAELLAWLRAQAQR